MSRPAANPSTHQADDLETHVEAVSLGLKALAVLLVRERQALIERVGAEVLDTIAIDKQEAVANVTALYGLLRDSLEYLSVDGTDFADSVASLKRSHPHLATQVDELVALTRECQTVNQENGVLVNARLNGTRGALESLRDAGAGADAPGVYGPVGGTSPRTMAGDRFTARA